MENYSLSEVLSIIENEQLEWQRSCDQLCMNPLLSESDKDAFNLSCDIRVSALEQLKLRFV